MTVHFTREVEALKKKILALGAEVENNVHCAVKALQSYDIDLAQKIIDGDADIDRKEVEIEEDCLKILALYQPVAIDLRFLVTVLKINNDLERIADLAVNIAERTIYLARNIQNKVELKFDFELMAEKVQLMLKNSLDALINRDVEMAQEVMNSDDEIDSMHREIYKMAKEAIGKNIDGFDWLVHLLIAARQLERLADLATNIAEDVIYMIEGKIVRHQELTSE